MGAEQLLCTCFVFITWIFVSNLARVVIGCPPPDLIHPCKCEDVATLNCDNVTSSEELAFSLNIESNDVGVFDNVLVNHSPILTLPGNVFSYIKAKTFRITNNHNLDYVGEDAFAGSEDIAESVMLNNNSIWSDTVFDATSKLKKLRYLDLERNQLEKIPDNAYVNLKELRIAKLSYNLIESIGSRAFANLTHLEKLDFRHNKIVSIGEYCFFNLPQLEEIILSENSLKTVGDHAFALGPITNPDLQTTTIWLNDNELTGFWPKAFEGLARNALIHMFHNQLKTFPENLYVSILNHFHSLNSEVFLTSGLLDLGNNPFVCDCNVKWLVENHRYFRYAQDIVCVENGRPLQIYQLSDFKDCDSI